MFSLTFGCLLWWLLAHLIQTGDVFLQQWLAEGMILIIELGVEVSSELMNCSKSNSAWLGRASNSPNNSSALFVNEATAARVWLAFLASRYVIQKDSVKARIAGSCIEGVLR